MTPYPRHARRKPRELGYRITMAVINVCFAIVLLPVVAIVGGPFWYELGI